MREIVLFGLLMAFYFYGVYQEKKSKAPNLQDRLANLKIAQEMGKAGYSDDVAKYVLGKDMFLMGVFRSVRERENTGKEKVEASEDAREENIFYCDTACPHPCDKPYSCKLFVKDEKRKAEVLRGYE